MVGYIRPYVRLGIDNDRLRTWKRAEQPKRVPGSEIAPRSPAETVADNCELIAAVIAKNSE
jgi:hypothetical protein